MPKRKCVDVKYKHFMKRVADACFQGHRLADDLPAAPIEDGEDIVTVQVLAGHARKR